MPKEKTPIIRGSTAGYLTFIAATGDDEKNIQTCMGPTSRENAPQGKIRKYDLVVAKNHPTEDELFESDFDKLLAENEVL